MTPSTGSETPSETNSWETQYSNEAKIFIRKIEIPPENPSCISRYGLADEFDDHLVDPGEHRY